MGYCIRSQSRNRIFFLFIFHLFIYSWIFIFSWEAIGSISACRAGAGVSYCDSNLEDIINGVQSSEILMSSPKVNNCVWLELPESSLLGGNNNYPLVQQQQQQQFQQQPIKKILSLDSGDFMELNLYTKH